MRRNEKQKLTYTDFDKIEFDWWDIAAKMNLILIQLDSFLREKDMNQNSMSENVDKIEKKNENILL